MEERGLGAKNRPPSKRGEVKPAVDSFPTDGCGRPESIAGQAKIPQEAGERESNAHTTEKVSIYENQGELRPGTAMLSPAFSDLAPWGPSSQDPSRQRQKSLWTLLVGH